MNRFAYREAQTVQEAIETLSQEEGARIVAGATDVLIRWRQGVWKPRYVLNIKRIPGLDEVSYSPETGLSLGTLVTIRTLERHPLIHEHYPALAQAATAFAGVQIRHLATVGGNICNASPAGDTLPALLAYGAECRIVGPGGRTSAALGAFFPGPRPNGAAARRAAGGVAPATAPAPHRGAVHQAQSPQHHGYCHGRRGIRGLVGGTAWRVPGGPDHSRCGGANGGPGVPRQKPCLRGQPVDADVCSRRRKPPWRRPGLSMIFAARQRIGGGSLPHWCSGRCTTRCRWRRAPTCPFRPSAVSRSRPFFNA